MSASLSSWENFGTEANVSLDKKWTVKFSGSFDYDSIAAASLVKGNEFIPVKVSKGGDDKLVVFPLVKYAGNTKYSLRIVLTNGKKYKKDFTTINEHRNADIEPNNSILTASPIHTNEKVVGEITKSDKDYYRVEVPKEGILQLDLLSLEQKGLSLYLYGEDYEKGYMKNFSNKSKDSLTEGVLPGIYYVYVTGYYDSTESGYELNISYYPSEHKDDNAGNKFINATKINLNEKFTGHIGYKNASGWGNYYDYYMIEVNKEGTLQVDLLSLEQKGLSLYLYGEDYEKGYMKNFSNKSKDSISEGLLPGIYYIYVTGYYDSTYSPYELNVSYYPSKYKNDSAGNKFINATKINLNEKFTGHIGYKSASGWGNYSDYYMIEVNKEGTLQVDLMSLEQKGLSLYLYGEDYEKGYKKSFSNKSKGNLIQAVLPGTYYVYVTGYYDSTYSPYELSVIFE